MLTIDGSRGEGGGQILRTALALSLLTGTPFSMTNVRAGRSRPGLMRQHLAAVRAAAEVGHAELAGAEVGSSELTFRPGGLADRDEYSFAVGTAGSATLVLQTVLFAFVPRKKRVRLVLEGGTHNPFAPPFDFIDRAFAPLMRRAGLDVRVTLERHGFYPAGGGRFVAEIDTTQPAVHLELVERGAIGQCRALALLSQLPGNVGEREIQTLCAGLGWDRATGRPQFVESPGPGNALVAEVASEHVTEVFVGFGERGVRAETVAEQVVREAQRYLSAGVPVGEHLADQLLLPLAILAGGTFRTLAPTEHFRTQVATLRMFLGTEVRFREERVDVWRVEVPAP